MTTLALPRVRTTGPSRNSVLGFFSILFDGIREGREIAGRYNSLSRMSDSELAALGVAREDLPQAAVTGVKGL